MAEDRLDDELHIQALVRDEDELEPIKASLMM